MPDHQGIGIGGCKVALLNNRASPDEQRGGIIAPGGEGQWRGDGGLAADNFNYLVFGGSETTLHVRRQMRTKFQYRAGAEIDSVQAIRKPRLNSRWFGAA